MQYTTASCALDQRPMCPRRASKVDGQAASCARPRSQPSRFRKKRQTATQRRTKAMPATRYFSKPSPKSPKGMTTWAAAGVMTAAKETTRRERKNPWCNSSPRRVSNRWIEGSAMPQSRFSVVTALFVLGGEGGIRTPDTLASMPHFECGAFNHSATSPYRVRGACEGPCRVSGGT